MAIDPVPLASFVLVTTFTPGPNNISSASMGVRQGYRRSLGYLLGIASGFFIVMLACGFLSKVLLALSPAAERYLRWIGAGYIVWLALGTLRADYEFSETGGKAKAFFKGFLLQLVNPKVALYGLTLYSTFLAASSGQPGLSALFAAVSALVVFFATSTWALGGSAIRSKLKNDSFRKTVNIILALLLIYTAVELAGIMESG